jgi:hypothetical protein
VPFLLWNSGGQYAFSIRNHYEAPIYYTGYGRGLAMGAPLFGVEVLRDGQWTSLTLDWCVFGRGVSYIPSLTSIASELPDLTAIGVKNGEKIRVTLEVWARAFVEGTDKRLTICSNVVAYSPPPGG